MSTASKSTVVSLGAFTDGVELTPVRKRHARPSGSPVKSPEMATPLKHSKSMILPGTKPTRPDVHYDIPTAAVEFEGGSCRGADGRLSTANLTAAQDKALMEYLIKNYKAVTIDTSVPFLVIGCHGGPPPVDQRPFSIAGLIAIWRTAGDMSLRPIIGVSAHGDEIDLDEDIGNQLEPQTAPTQEAVLHLANKVFPRCIAISQIFNELVIELPLVSQEQFAKDLRKLPARLKGAGLLVTYHNGPLPGTERRRREVQLDGAHASGIDDETDYVTKDSKFYPGSMIGSLTLNHEEIFSAVTAGILVERAGAERLVCAFHCWELHANKFPTVLGRTNEQAQKVFAVQQGKKPGKKTGTVVGFLRERLGKTDIALAQLFPHINFDNQFMEMEFRPKTLLPSVKVNVNDEYVIDTFTTGKTKIKCLGRRFDLEKRPIPPLEPNAEELVLEPNVSYICLEQGVFARNTPFLSSDPLIRDGICGSTLLRCVDATRPKEDEKTVMERGEVAGIMHWIDLVSQDPVLQAPSPSHAKFYLCYADSFDPLIEDGWKVAQVEKEASPSESPTKKQKIATAPGEIPSQGGSQDASQGDPFYSPQPRGRSGGARGARRPRAGRGPRGRGARAS